MGPWMRTETGRHPTLETDIKAIPIATSADRYNCLWIIDIPPSQGSLRPLFYCEQGGRGLSGNKSRSVPALVTK